MADKTIFNPEAPLAPSGLPYTDTDDHVGLSNKGTKTHAQIDTHVGGDGTDHSMVAKNNLSASAYPKADDDSGDGYSVGSMWLDTTNYQAYICMDATATVAKWFQFTGSVIVSAPLLTAGYWHTTYWQRGYFFQDYFPEYGA